MFEETIAVDAKQPRTSVSTAQVRSSLSLTPSSHLCDTGFVSSTMCALQGQYVALKIGAAAYLECSAIIGHGVRAVIERAVCEGLTTRRRRLHGAV
jgi:hypothetical protein